MPKPLSVEEALLILWKYAALGYPDRVERQMLAAARMVMSEAAYTAYRRFEAELFEQPEAKEKK